MAALDENVNAACVKNLDSANWRAFSPDEMYTWLASKQEDSNKEVLDQIIGQWLEEEPLTFSADRSSPAYILKWLRLADNLQLGKLHEVCMAGFKKPLIKELSSLSFDDFKEELRGIGHMSLAHMIHIFVHNVPKELLEKEAKEAREAKEDSCDDS